MSIDALQKRFGIPGVAGIEEGRGSLPRVVVTSDLATAEIYLHGAHLTQYQPRAAKPVLFLSEKSHYDPSKPIRGGVPVIFPWFGPRAGFPDSPMHGVARTRSWDLESCAVQGDGSVRVAFTLSSDEATLKAWPHPFGLRMIFGLGRSLDMELEVRNPGGGPMTFEEALHTYFVVGDARQAEVTGLENVDYIDKADGFKRKTQPAEPIRIAAETDRVFLNTRSTCIVRDPVLERTLTVEKENSATTVVWNPWIAKAKALADFGDEEWPGMLCVETANAGEAAVRLEEHQSHRMKVRIVSG